MTTDISVGVRWDPLNGQEGNGHQNGEEFDFEYDGGNSSSRLFERSRIRALAGEISFSILTEQTVLGLQAPYSRLVVLSSLR